MGDPTTREVQACAVRDHCLELAKARGEWQAINNTPGRFLMGTVGAFRFLIRSPFNPLPATQGPAGYIEALAKQRGPIFEYALDLWYSDKKVLNLEWSGAGETRIVSFRRGPWEEELLQHLRPN